MRADALDEPLDLEQVQDPRLDTEAQVRFLELSSRLDMALGRLSLEHRRAFELAVIQRLVYAEIVTLTGWSLAKVKVNIHRARKHVISALSDYQHEPTRSSSNGE
jgi:DNA-directed RNA polymerase specialized sigma24 family protein